MRINKTILILVIAILAITITFLIVDCIMLNSAKEPIFCISIGQYLDGGTKEYIGLGYKIIDYNILSGFDGYKVGTWFMQYDNNIK